jgi:hypothetical protein
MPKIIWGPKCLKSSEVQKSTITELHYSQKSYEIQKPKTETFKFWQKDQLSRHLIQKKYGKDNRKIYSKY